jgi:translocator protein
MSRWLIFLPLGLGFSSTLLSKDLKRAPSSRFQPPGYVFSIVWPLLYLSMGYASYRISNNTKLPMVYFVQLLLNFSWSIIYTRLGVTPGLINIVLLLFFVMLTYKEFHHIDTTAANILLPYIA